jgi:hypothetical protein
MGAVRRRVGIAGLFGVVVALAPLAASAQQKPTSHSYEYSPYEKETIARALKATGLQIDPAPEGKIVERIDTLRLEVLEDRDPIPDDVLGIPARKIGNDLHYVSRDFVIRREVLIKEGDPYQQILADETARNMRVNMPLQVSLVIIVPVRTDTPGKVRLLVITKDIWSLRLSFDLSVTPGGLENLLIVPQETNLLGWQHTLSTRFIYQPETYTFGAGYKIPRFGSSWIGAAAAATVTFNRRSGEAEGSAASVSVGQGLYSTLTEWAWSASGSYATGVSRRYVNATVGLFDSASTPGVRDNIPTEFKTSSYSTSVGVTRSFGWGFKNNFGLTMNASSSNVSTIDADLAGRSPTAIADFRSRFIPIGETRVYPALGWATFSNDYLRTLDISTLALQEDVQLGHDIGASVYPVRKALGSTRDLIGFTGHAGYSVALGDGYAGASAALVQEYEDSNLSDASVSGGINIVTPRTGVGRVVMNASFISRYKNYLNAKTITGGNDRLRGYPSNFFFGPDAVFYNLEFRSTSVEILKCAFGGVVFYDAGDATEGFRMLNAKQSVGFGVRALFPQVNRAVFRFDLAFPLQRGPFPETGIPTPVDPVGFYFSFGQAF